MEEIRLVVCSFPDGECARRVGTAMVERQLAACVSLVPGVESVYRWQGRVERADEVLAVFKTTAAAWPALREALAAEHPYEVPEIVALAAAGVAEAYGRWLLSSVAVPDR